MIRRISVGDPITIISAYRGVATHQLVTRVDPDGEVVVNQTLTDGPGSHIIRAEEGVSWIRGHHEVDAPEVRAAMAATLVIGNEPIHPGGPMKVLFICDPNWSTGNIVKSLDAVFPNHEFVMHDWSVPLPDTSGYDAVVSMSITGPARNPSWRTLGMASVLCGPGEMQLPEVTTMALPINSVIAGVSRECAQLLRGAFPAAFVHTTPGFAHPQLFRRNRTGPVRRAGFVGLPVAQNMQVSGPAKRPEMFKAICAAAGVEPVFSEHRYKFEDMQQFYDSVDVVISTSSAEGGPFSPIEAIACGVPALSTNVGIIRDMELPGRFETVEEAAVLVKHAYGFLPAQQVATEKHRAEAIKAWFSFLEHVADVRAQHRHRTH